MDVFKNVCSVLAAVFVIYIVYTILKKRSVLKKVYKLPGPPRIPIFGNFFELFNCDSVQLFEKFREWGKKYSPVYSFSVLGLPVVVVTGPDEFEKIASGSKHLTKGITYTLVEPWLGKGLLTNSGSLWQQRRKILTPAFHFSILQEFLKVFNKETARLVEIIKQENKKSATNIVPLISQTTLNTIAETSFGTTLDLTKKDDKNYVSAIHEMGKIVIYRIVRPWFHTLFMFNILSSLGARLKEVLSTLHGFTERIVLERSRDFKPFEVNKDDETKRKKLAFLDLLLNAKISKGIIDDQGIMDEVNTFMFEGHDTTATGLSWALRQLAIHTEYQDQIYEEIITVLGDAKKQPDLNDLNELKVMERFIKETLRLFPAVPIISRMLDEDTELNGYLVPKEAPIDIWIYDIHRNPKYWPEPEKFDPDRFLPENCVNRHPFAFVPFSAGPRNCIGQRFAMYEMKAILCGILQNFSVEIADKNEKVEIITDLVLRSAHAINLKFIPRTN
ncbi:cytochrome P450 4C1-like [Diabrotica undecimpunctata]|uniref:cytochrome P450 4C1-like n=1 Tax=Diabrotica undecimpunctata TaxID=50387 RepID=UPI003B641741